MVQLWNQILQSPPKLSRSRINKTLSLTFSLWSWTSQTQSLANPGFGQLWRWLESLIPKQDQRVKFSQGRVEWLGVRITVFINICSKDILSQSHYITSLSTSPDFLPTNSHIKTRGWRSIKVYHISWILSQKESVFAVTQAKKQKEITTLHIFLVLLSCHIKSQLYIYICI